METPIHTHENPVVPEGNNDKPFSFENINYWLDEARYLRVSEMILAAAQLVGDGAGGELGENVEYERGMAELICDTGGIPMDLKEQVLEEIHATARASAQASFDHHLMGQKPGRMA